MQMESDWFRKAGEGDMQAIEKICSATWEPLYRFIYYKVGNRQEAEDITQETYVRTLSAFRKNILQPEKYIGFLRTTALNILRDRWRQAKRRALPLNLDLLEPSEAVSPDQTENASTRSQIIHALNSLKEDQRAVIVLRLVQGYSVSETAVRMNKREGNIRILQYRALRALSETLGDLLGKEK